MSENEDTGYAEAWRPEPGGKVAGKVVAITMGPDMGYGPYPIVTLNTQEGERAIHAFHTVLRTELARRRPKVGDELEVTYQGKRSPKSGNGNDFHVYRVVGGQEPEFNWDAELPPEERSAGAFGDAGSSGRATAEPPIAPAPVPAADEWAPLPKPPSTVTYVGRAPLPKPPSAQEKAAQFGEAPPF